MVTSRSSELASEKTDGHRDSGVATPVQYRRHDGRAGARAAGQRLSAAPLPYAHFDPVAGEHPDEFRVYSVGEDRQILELRSDLVDLDGSDVGDEGHGVGVAHGDGGDAVFRAVHRYGFVYHRVAAEQHRYLGRGEDRPAHSHAD